MSLSLACLSNSSAMFFRMSRSRSSNWLWARWRQCSACCRRRCGVSPTEPKLTYVRMVPSHAVNVGNWWHADVTNGQRGVRAARQRLWLQACEVLRPARQQYPRASPRRSGCGRSWPTLDNRWRERGSASHCPARADSRAAVLFRMLFEPTRGPWSQGCKIPALANIDQSDLKGGMLGRLHRQSGNRALVTERFLEAPAHTLAGVIS